MKSQKKSHNKAFGIVLRRIRTERCQTQEALAFDSGLDRTYISLLELGSYSPTLDTIMALCLALDVSLTHVSSQIEEVMREDETP